MTLYTEPPSGNISIQKLEKFALKRLDFLLKVRAARGDVTKLHHIVCDPENMIDSDCLIIGSVKDKISHFILRLLLGGDAETQQFFQDAETAWFDFKFSCMSEDEMNKFFRSVDKILKKGHIQHHKPSQPLPSGAQSIDSILGVFRRIKQAAGSWKDAVRLYMTQCNSSQFSVPFQCVWRLVAKRQVTLHRGMAQVPFSRMREVVTEQFSSLMLLAVIQASLQFPVAITDGRLRLLWRKLKLIYRKHVPDPTCLGVGLVPGLSFEQVDSMAEHYPLCMASLLRSLRRKHRLGHHARIQLTLFLKELGLPVHHALALWQGEYSLPSAAGTSCTHSWQSDGPRYTYSIRHLYGLEGSRRNYRAHCCQSLQERIVGCNEEGGCPFSTWDNGSLAAELVAMGLQPKDIENSLSLCEKGLFSAACHQCLQNIKNKKVQAEEPCCEVSDLQSKHLGESEMCHQVTISSSPDILLYRTDCSMNQVCDVEDLLKTKSSESVEKTCMIQSIVKYENRVSLTTCGTERSRHNKQETDVCEHKAAQTSVCHCAASRGNGESTTSKPLIPQLRPSKVEDSTCSKLAEQSEKHPVLAKSQELQCFVHEVCPSQSIDQDEPHCSSKASSSEPLILRPVHYVHTSYQRLLHGLKTCASSSTV